MQMDSLLYPRQITRVVNTLFDKAIKVPPVGNARVVSAFLEGYVGTNQFKTHPFQKKYSKNEHCIYLHAEVDSIVRFLNYNDVSQLAEQTLVVVRAKRDGVKGKWVHGLAKPCEGCQRAIAAFGIKNVVYTTGDPNFPLDNL